MAVVTSEEKDFQRGVDFVGVSVCFLVHDGRGKVLLQKRSKNTRDEQGNWDIGGGALELGEMLNDAVSREVNEELGVKPSDIKFLHAGEAHRKNSDTQTHWIWLLHSAKVNPAKVKINEPLKIDEIGWFTSESLPSPKHTLLDTAVGIGKQAGIIR